jgi:hypothetical protein
MTEIPKYFPEIQNKRDELAKEVRSKRTEAQNLKKKSEKLGSKVRETLGMRGSTSELKDEAARLKLDSEDALRSGKFQIYNENKELVKDKVKNLLVEMFDAEESEVPSLVSELYNNEQYFITALNDESERDGIVFLLERAISTIENSPYKTALKHLVTKHYEIIRKRLQIGNTSDLRLISELWDESTPKLKNTIVKDLEKQLDNLLQASLEGSVGVCFFAMTKIIEEGSREAKVKILEFTRAEFHKPNPSFAAHMCTFPETRDFSFDILRETLLNKYGLEFDPRKEWAPSEDETNYTSIYYNLKTIDEIEEERPGIAAVLNKQFGIREFLRYPSALLVEQYDNIDSEKPYGIVIYPTEDHNNAFDQDYQVFEKLHEQLKGKYLIRVFECTTRADVGRAFLSMDKKHGKDNKISFAILGGHGIGDSMVFGIDEQRQGRGWFHLSMVKKPAVKKMRKFFTKHPTIILASCATGQELGLAHSISEEFPEARVIGPEKPTGVNSITAQFEGDEVILDAKYWKEGEDILYTKGARTN